MQAFLWAMAGNTLFAALLAGMVWLAGRVLQRRPALIHALWILVLLKLVTPPLFDASAYFSTDYFSADSFSAGDAPVVISKRAVSQESEPIAIEEDLSESIALMESQLRRAQEAKIAHESRAWWPTVLIAAWVVGSFGFLSLAIYRAVRFSWLLRSAELADGKLIEIAQAQADRLGLRCLPAIKVVTAVISPLVWQTPLGTSVILPQKLVNELGPDQLRLLLAHELAHVKRGDPLVRWFALGVLTCHWWNPIVWLAMRQIEAAQEACCDSLVLSASGASPKRYAEMLLTTVDFLAGQETPPSALAAGFTSGSSLKGRCEMILSKRTPFALARTTRWALAVLGLAILPLSTPIFGQEEKKPSGDELAARVEKIEKMLEEMKALLSNRAAEEKEVRAKLEASQAELAAKLQQRNAEEVKLREQIEVARAKADDQRAKADKEMAKIRENADKRPNEDLGKIQKEIQDKVRAELAKVQEEVAKATKMSAEAAAKMAKDVAKTHGEDAAKYAEKLSADINAKIKDQVAHAEKIARDHAEHAEKFAKEHAKHFEEHAKHAEEVAKEYAKRYEEHAKHAEKYAEEHAKHAEKFAEEHARKFQEHAEKFAHDAEKHAKEAIEQDLPKLKEQMKLEAEKLSKVAEEMSKNADMKKEFEKLKELGKLKERRMKEDSSDEKVKEKRKLEERVREERVKDDAKSEQRRELEQQLREREERIRALQREVEKLRKELGGDRIPKRGRERLEGDVVEIPVLNKIPYVSRLFRNKNADELVDEVAIEEIEMDVEIDEEIDVDVDVELEEMEVEAPEEIEEPAEVEEQLERFDRLIERKIRDEGKDAPSAIEVLKRESTKSADAPVKP